MPEIGFPAEIGLLPQIGTAERNCFGKAQRLVNSMTCPAHKPSAPMCLWTMRSGLIVSRTTKAIIRRY